MSGSSWPSDQPSGKPIRRSTHIGLRYPPARSRIASVSVVPSCIVLVVVVCLPLCLASPTVVVGHSDNEDAFASVRGANVSGSDETSVHSIPKPVDVGDNSVQPSRHKRRHVFRHDDVGLALVDDAVELGPESAPFAFDAFPASCKADVLAGESPDDGERLEVEAFRVDMLYILELNSVGPVCAQHATAEGISLSNGAHRPEPSELASKVESADP